MPATKNNLAILFGSSLLIVLVMVMLGFNTWLVLGFAAFATVVNLVWYRRGRAASTSTTST